MVCGGGGGGKFGFFFERCFFLGDMGNGQVWLFLRSEGGWAKAFHNLLKY